MQQGNIVSFGSAAASQRPTLDEKSRQTVDECRGVYLKKLPPLLTSLFETLDDAFYDLSDKSESEHQQASYFEAMRLMRKERSRIERQFRDKVLVEYDRFWTHGPDEALNNSAADGLSTELSLLGEEALEESLAITSMVSKYENCYQRDLESLNERFAHILKSEQITHQNNPVGPMIIGSIFQQLMNPVLIELPVKLVIYKLFDKVVMRNVGVIYDDINLHLKKRGVMPQLAFRIRRNNSASPQRNSPSNPGVTEGGHVNAVQSELFQAIQGLLANRDNSGGVQSPGAPVAGLSLPAVETSDLIETLSELQSCNITLVAYVGANGAQHNLRQMLVKSLQMETAGEPNKSLGKGDNDTIDVLSMVFEYILDDSSLPDPMKALIGRLQIPMLKIALVDKSFFSKEIHPARQFLNSVARASVGWSDDGDRSERNLYGVVEAMLKRILNEFQQDPGLFEELNEELAAFVAIEERGADVAEGRTNQVVRGKEQLKIAKMHVSNEINSRLGQRTEVPQAVYTLLNDGWKDVLLLLYLRQGVESKVWENAIEVMEVLLWSVELKSESADRKELLKKIPHLLRALREGLTEISFDQHKMTRLFKELQRCHLLSMKGKTDTENMVKVEQLARDESLDLSGVSLKSAPVDDNPFVEEQGGITQDHFFNQAVTLKVGTWFELNEEDEDKRRIKLSWKSEVTNTLVFVNRHGIKAKEIMVDEFASLLRAGQVIMLKGSTEPLMDRALKAMMDVLKKTGPTTATS